MNIRGTLKPGPESVDGLDSGTFSDRHRLSTGEAVPPPVYGVFYDLKESPFDLTPNPRFLFLSTCQREALSNLRYGLASRKGFTLLVGDAGLGKTTLVRAALAGLNESDGHYALVSNPTLKREEFYDYLAHQFGLSANAARSKGHFLTELQSDVEARHAAGGFSALIVDEAQNMSDELLEEIRLLGNIETTTTKLLNIVLCGHPALATRLNEPSLTQLKQRIALRCELRAFTLAETAGYISGRLRIAGGSPADAFTIEAVTGIHNAAAGVPRLVNVLCDNALITGFAAQVKPVTLKIVQEACRDFDLTTSAGVADESGKASGALDTRDRRVSEEPPPAPKVHDSTMFSSMHPKPKRRFSFFS